MAPVMYIAFNLGQLPCNASDVIVVGFPNSTSALKEESLESYDYNGAMKFIVTTLMVYSLMGISGLLLQRIRRHASRTHRVVSIREEHLQQYIKRADDLKLAGYRHKLKMDASRMIRHLQNLERQKSYTRSDSQQNNDINDSTTLLSDKPPNGQQSQPPDFNICCSNTPPPLSPGMLILPPLPEESPVITSLEIEPEMFRFCNHCGAQFTDSPDQDQEQFTWTKL